MYIICKCTYELEYKSKKYKLSLFISYDQIIFKLESKNNNENRIVHIIGDFMVFYVVILYFILITLQLIFY